MRITKSLGSYNFMKPQEKQWSIYIYFDDGRVLNELFPEDDEPDIDGVPPSELVDLIEARLNKYLFNSSRGESLEKIKWIRDNAELADSQWAEKEIKNLKKQSERIATRIKNLSYYLQDEQS